MALRFINNNNKGFKQSVSDTSILNAKIITDEPEKDASDFGRYANELSRIIINSTPRFTVGIYGGWGTGKTTLMEMIKHDFIDYLTNTTKSIDVPN